jgi:hypothetical protein
MCTAYLKVVAERPVAQHFKESVMVYVLADIVKVIVLAPRANAFLGVSGARQLRHGAIGVHNALEDGLELRIGSSTGSWGCQATITEHNRIWLPLSRKESMSGTYLIHASIGEKQSRVIVRNYT